MVLVRDRQPTGADGRFAFRAADVPAGTRTLIARHPTGAPVATGQAVFRPGGTPTVDFALPAR